MSLDLDEIESRIADGIYGDDRLPRAARDDAFSALAEIIAEVERLRAEVERLRYLLRMATGIRPRDVAEATVFSQREDLYSHKFQHKYADAAACGYRPRGPYQPLREEDLTCPDCIDVIRAVELSEYTPKNVASTAARRSRER